MNSCHGVATRRYPIPFETEYKRKDPKNIQLGEVRSVEDGNSEGKDRTSTVELQSHYNSMWGSPIPRYSLHTPIPTQPLLSSALLFAQNVQKRHT